LASSSRRVQLGGLGGPSSPLARQRSGGSGKRQGCQRFGRLGSARKKTPRTNPDGPPKQIRHREMPDLPVSWLWVQAHRPRAKRELRRDAGNRRGAGARSRSSGKQKSVGTHRGRPSRRVARQAVEGRSSPEHPIESADAGDGGSSLNRTSLRRAGRWGAQALRTLRNRVG
jgi:hypothetical protein